MTTRQTQHVHLGFAVGTGEPVEVPLGHLVCFGVTQMAGKTTALEALVTRAGVKGLAFITKRGEGGFANARSIEPYYSESSDGRPYWQFVESIVSTVMQESKKFERAWIVKAARGARTLADVKANIPALMKSARRDMDRDIFMLLDEYLGIVIPQIESLPTAAGLELTDGLNVMDLTGYSEEMQMLLVRSAIEWVHRHEKGVVTVIPEAWKFCPDARMTPVKPAVERLIREGAGLGNFVWSDSQDAAGLWKLVQRPAKTWLIGVQREHNEVKRTLANIPGTMAKPNAADVATLELGQFYACWGTHAVKTYVQPAWMGESQARAIATGETSIESAMRRPAMTINTRDERGRKRKLEPRTAFALAHVARVIADRYTRQTESENDTMSKEDVDRLEKTIERTMGDVAKGIRDLAGQMAAVKSPPGAKAAAAYAFGNGERHASASPAPESIDEDAMYQRFKARLASEAPALLKVATTTSEMEVACTRKVLETDETSALGMIAILLKDGWFGESPKKAGEVWKEMKRRWNYGGISARAYEQLDKLTAMGFVTKEGEGYKAVAGMKITKKER